MREVRNANNKLVAIIDDTTNTIEIVLRGCATRFHLNPDGTIEVIILKEN